MGSKLIDMAHVAPLLSTDRVGHRRRRPTVCPLPKKNRECLPDSKIIINFANGTQFRTYFTEAICSFLLIENLRNSSTTAQETRHIGSCVVTGRGHFRYPFLCKVSQDRQSAKRGTSAPALLLCRTPSPPAAGDNLKTNAHEQKLLVTSNNRRRKCGSILLSAVVQPQSAVHRMV